MRITSPAFSEGGVIPIKYTCDGQDLSPALEISGAPTEAQSLVLIMEDPDVPKSIRPDGMWDHWVVFNIPPTVTEIKEGKNPPGLLGINTSGKLSYGGPCPPDREHRYFFKLYALDAELNLFSGASKGEVKEAMVGHIIAQAELVGRYERVK